MSLLNESLVLRKDAESKPGIAECFERLGMVAAEQGRLERAARLLGAAEALREATDTQVRAVDRADHERAAASVRSGREAKRLDRVWAEGRAMTLEQAVEYALAFPEAERPAGKRLPAKRADGGALTVREQEVVRLVARGLTNREIAATLVVSGRTADAHVQNILNKLGFNSRAQIAAWAVARGLNDDRAS